MQKFNCRISLKWNIYALFPISTLLDLGGGVGGGNIWDKIVFQILKFLRMCLFRRLIFFRILLGYLSFKVLVLKFMHLHLRLSYFQVWHKVKVIISYEVIFNHSLHFKIILLFGCCFSLKCCTKGCLKRLSKKMIF